MKRNVTLDYFKLFLSFLVILAHIQPITGVWNSLLSYMISNGYARITVPCFFIINGYFFYPKLSDFKKVRSFFSKIIIVYLIWTFIYLGLMPEKPSELIDYLLLFFMGNGNLWYVAAMIVGVFLYYILVKICRKDLYLFICAVLLFLIGYLIQYSLKIQLVKEFDNFNLLNVHKCRNALFIALPFIILGGIINSKIEVFKRISIKVILSVIVVAFVVLTIEAYYSYSTYYASDVYIAIFILSPSLFLCVLRYSKLRKGSDYIGHLSQAVYFIHPFAIWIVFSIFSISQFGDNKIYYLPIIFFLSLLMSTGIIQLNKNLKVFL